MDELTQSITRFCNLLTDAEIRYVIGGSVASGIWGEPRQTNDVDVEVWIKPHAADSFLFAFDESYLVSKEELLEALSLNRPFTSVQVLDTKTLLKFDCFLQLFGAAEEEMFEHSQEIALGEGVVRVACAEHILVQKLRWYEFGSRVSERQWRDLQGIVKVNPDLRWNLVERWATVYGVTDLVAVIRSG